MQRSQSDSSGGDLHCVDQQQHHASESPYQPAKRVKRLFYDPERVTGMDKVFCEYDWRTHTFSPTLRDISPPQQHSPRLPSQIMPSNERTVVSKSDANARSPRPGQKFSSTRASCAGPRSCTSQVPDETLVSNYLLSSSTSSTSSSPMGIIDNDDPWVSNVFLTSPISHAEPTFSPLQQSIMAYAEQDRVASGSYVHHPTPVSACFAQQSRPPAYENKASPRNMHGHRTAPAAFFDAVFPSAAPETSSYPKPYIKNTRVSSLQLKNAQKAEAQSSSRLSAKDELRSSLQPPQRPQMFLRRRSSAPEKRDADAPPVVSKARSRSESGFHQNSHRRVHFFDEALGGYTEEATALDDMEVGTQEDDEDEDGIPQSSSKEGMVESRLAGLVSALHYQYVSVGMRIQLAVHRTEKKVARKLSGRRGRQATA